MRQEINNSILEVHLDKEHLTPDDLLELEAYRQLWVQLREEGENHGSKKRDDETIKPRR